jgi:hypothetical protein
MRTRPLTAGIAAVVILSCSSFVFAEPHWTRIGPEGGLPYALAIPRTRRSSTPPRTGAG